MKQIVLRAAVSEVLSSVPSVCNQWFDYYGTVLYECGKQREKQTKHVKNTHTAARYATLNLDDRGRGQIDAIAASDKNAHSCAKRDRSMNMS